MLLAERSGIVEHICDTTAHAGGEVSPNSAKHDDDTAGHVLAAVVTDTFDDSNRAAVANRETFARRAGDERLTAHGTIQSRVANDDGCAGQHPRRFRRMNHESATRQPF